MDKSDNWIIFMLASLQKLHAVVEAAEIFVGPDNIGKTVDTSVEWGSDPSCVVSACFKRDDLWKLVKALEALDIKDEP